MSNRKESETCSTPRSTASEPMARIATTRVRSTRRRQRIQSIGLRPGRIHSIWKPKQRSATDPLELDEVQAKPIQRKETLYDRQWKVLARIQITQQVLKTQQKELAATHSERGEEVGERREDGRRKKSTTSSSSSLPVQPGLKWQRAIKTMIEEKSNKDKKKDVAILSRRFHNLVSQQVAAMSKSSQKTLQDQEPDVFSPPASTLTRRNRFSTRVVPIQQLIRRERSTEQASSPSFASPTLRAIAEEN